MNSPLTKTILTETVLKETILGAVETQTVLTAPEQYW
jgi:hypothetical protein